MRSSLEATPSARTPCSLVHFFERLIDVGLV
jgi:hypothetical protein